MAKPQRTAEEFPYHRPRDTNQLAHYVVGLAVGDIEERPKKTRKKKRKS